MSKFVDGSALPDGFNAVSITEMEKVEGGLCIGEAIQTVKGVVTEIANAVVAGVGALLGGGR
jgi:hypothetical protein